jgi:pimeloyl-ACP methyl ester carboxylesterase
MRNRRNTIAIFAIIGALVLSFLAYTELQKTTFRNLSDYYNQKISWSSCYDNYECAEFAVPIDYQRIKTGTFKISALRYRAQDPKHRIGSLIVNPGGPGASGVDYAYNAEYIFDPDITDRYDIVGFDPRGVNLSAPIHCVNAAETDANYASDSKPDTNAEFQAAIRDAKDFVKKCELKNKHLTSYTTANAARDMDILRALVGDKKLNYMGKSYGTYLGALYASLFPNNIGRVVLDGAVDPTISDVEMTKSQAVGFDLAFNDFVKDCLQVSSCPLTGTPQEATTQFLAFLHSAAKKPLPLKNVKGDKRVVTESLLVVGTASALYESTDGWPRLRKAIREARDGYADTYIKLADEYTGREKDGTYPRNEFDSGAIIDCLDFSDHRSPDQIRIDAAAIAKAAPVFGPYIAYSGLMCKYLASPEPTEVVKTKTNAPVIIIGTTGDPATPYAWAKGLASLLPNSRLLTFVGDGHTGHGRGSACIDDAVDAYYLKGTLPAAGLRCSL